MIRGFSPVVQGVLGTIFTWFVTALGAGVVFIFPSSLSAQTEGVLLDACLGFSAGVMLAASYWSLLAPAIELAEVNGYESFAFLPATVGFFLGSLTVWTADIFLPNPENITGFLKDEASVEANVPSRQQEMKEIPRDGLRRRKTSDKSSVAEDKVKEEKTRIQEEVIQARSWRRVLLLVIAMTIHNFPEGLAVGVAFGSIGKSPSATFEAATVLAIGIGLQNFPEGLAVSLPMHREKRTKINSFFWGQMSGAVEPIGGFIGAIAVEYAEWFLPYALGFAAGAMIYVVVDSIIPEAQERGNRYLYVFLGKNGILKLLPPYSTHASWGAIAGFILMMAMDVALG